MSDDFEDFSDGEAPVPLSQRPGRPSASTSRDDDDTGGYRMKGSLKAPRPTSYTTQALFDQMIAGDIDTDPHYQRDVVWPEHKQMGLIDSIFRNFYVPPLIFAVTYRDDGSERRTSIDGKQRLTSIRRFMQGEIMYKDPSTGEKFVYDGSDRFSGAKLLPERYRKIFRTKQIVCIEYQDLTNANEREIFQRVQLGMALTPAEKLQAITSPTSDFIHELRSKYVSPIDEAGLSTLLEWDISRGADFRCLVHAVHSIGRWPNLNTFTGVSGLTKWVEREEELEPKLIASVHQTMDIFLMLARESRSTFKLPDVKKVSPAEFIGIAVLIHVWKAKLSAGALKKAIRSMRLSVREKEQDIRTNKRVMELLWTFIRQMNQDAYRMGDEVPATKARPLKRKRRDDDEMSTDSDEREHKQPPSRRKAVPKEESMPTVSQVHAMASRPQPACPAPTSRPSAPSTSAAQPLNATAYSSAAPDRLSALHAARQSGQDLSYSQLASSRAVPHIPAPSFSSAPGPPPLLSQPMYAGAEEARDALEKLRHSEAWPENVQYPIVQTPARPAQDSQQQVYRY